MKEKKEYRIYSSDMLQAFRTSRMRELADGLVKERDIRPEGRKTHCGFCGEKLKVHSWLTKQQVDMRIKVYEEMRNAFSTLSELHLNKFWRWSQQIEDVARFGVIYAHVREPEGGCELYVGERPFLGDWKKQKQFPDYNHLAACLAADNNPTGGRLHIPQIRAAESELEIRFDAATVIRRNGEFVPQGCEVIHTHSPDWATQRANELYERGIRQSNIYSDAHSNGPITSWPMLDDGVLVEEKHRNYTLSELSRLNFHGDKEIARFGFVQPAHPRVIGNMAMTGHTQAALHIPGLDLLLGIEPDEKYLTVGRPTIGRNSCEIYLLRNYENFCNPQFLAA